MNTQFIWTKKCKKSFLELKRRLTTTLVLALPVPHKPMMVFSNASKFALRCFLIQDGQVVSYAFCQLKDHEKNYPMHDLELATVRRWLETISDYKCWIKYHLGKADLVVDALSQKSQMVDIAKSSEVDSENLLRYGKKASGGNE
ncbi:hypothetical protein F2P56_010668 [Juglans regia]|uniref:Uncharacterized protein LOC109021556 n=2 Tax=Juglans regia TaxID=51240 RepID=A0A2I4HUG0_JUGRE|nr:uncharacterized protein LOC109021556 [Juglans regia]KAF5470134.1 hypothetical protein F2P56_010668 [Juglans regia]